MIGHPALGVGERRRLPRIVAAALFASILLPSLGQGDESKLVRFELADQFDRKHSDTEVRGRILLLIGSDRGGSRYQGAWVDALRASVSARGTTDAVRIVEVADLRGVPFFVKGSVKRKFPSDKRQWVLMDWKGSLARAYRFEHDACNVLLFDQSGNLVHRHAGQDFEPRVLDLIDGLVDTQLAAKN